MNWRRAIIGASIALPIVALLTYGMTQDPKYIASPLPGKPAPLFTLNTMDGDQTISLEQLRGKVVVLNFWASWCLPCRAEHPVLAAAAEAYKARGVEFYGVLYQDSPENGREWLKAMGGQNYLTLIDPGSRVAIDFGLSGVPETFVVDQNGGVARKIWGPVLPAPSGTITPEALYQMLDSLLAKRQTALR
jgi:cytochrome c biogenesis protein CcmG, thiol:disulfide interchange protein DsbE